MAYWNVKSVFSSIFLRNKGAACCLRTFAYFRRWGIFVREVIVGMTTWGVDYTFDCSSL